LNRVRLCLSSVQPLSALVGDFHRFEPHWSKVGRVYRRICFLKAEGRNGEARKIEDTDLVAAVAEARGSVGTEIEAETRLSQVKAEGEALVTEAIAYAEVLVPMLTDRLRSLALPGAAAAPAAPVKRRKAEAPGESRGIADFIDEMLAQDDKPSH
jgi:hypothetical protein